MVWQRPGLIGSPGWVRSSAWIWLFSSSERTTACAGGSTHGSGLGPARGQAPRPTMSVSLAKAGVARALEGAQAMRLQVVRPPDALHRTRRDAGCLGHRPAGPVGRLVRRFGAEPAPAKAGVSAIARSPKQWPSIADPKAPLNPLNG